jgi:sRNA-binding carbon storage regulator CsrA
MALVLTRRVNEGVTVKIAGKSLRVIVGSILGKQVRLTFIGDKKDFEILRDDAIVRTAGEEGEGPCP